MVGHLREYGPAYIVATAVTLAVLLLRLELWTWLGGSVLLPFILPVLVAAWYGGLRPGLLATALSVLAADYFLLEPTYSLAIAQASDQVWTALFALIGIAISGISEAKRKARRQHNQSEEIAASARAQLQLVADSVPALISYVDTDFRYVLNNEAYREWFGFAPGELKGLQVRDVVGEASWQVIRPHAETALSGQFVEYEMEVKLPRGGKRWAYVTNTPDIAPDGRVRGYVAHVTDITARKQTEETLREADRRKNDFLATLAHELRNPLAPLRNGLQLLKLTGNDPEQVEQTRGMMERQLEQMVRLIDDLLDVSRITRDRLELRKDQVRLDEVIRSAVEGCRSFIEDCGHELSVTLPPEPVYLHADPVRLAQVIFNLLSNATKYMNPGGLVRLAAEQRGADVVISVKDTGIGIKPEHLPHIFGMFAQVDVALERSQGGLGIGLSLARGLIEMHGGSIEARSEGPGRGSEFVIRLPTIAGQAREEAQPDDSAAAAGPARRRILVVDDYRDSAETLSAMLGLMGHDTRTARDGVEAVEAAADFQPDVVLLDIGLPNLNGYEAARRIRKQPGGKQIVLVAVTGWGQNEDKRLADEAGFDIHLTKPVSPETLRSLLAKWHPDRKRAGDVPDVLAKA
ncbi:MAG: hybrid sensor histidine kinase/response regulator [Gammaproteobacteria bacterium]